MFISQLALFKWNASPLLRPRFSISAVIPEAGQAKVCFYNRRFHLKKKINSFILKQGRSQNLYHTQYLDLFNLKRAVANYHSVYPDRKYLTCFSCGPSVFSLFCLTTPSFSCPRTPFAGGCKTPFVIWHFHTEVAEPHNEPAPAASLGPADPTATPSVTPVPRTPPSLLKWCHNFLGTIEKTLIF